MLKTYLILQTLVVFVCANGEFTIFQRPSSIAFKGHDRLKESLLKDVYTAALGFTTEQNSNWQGMYLLNPFELPEAIVTIAVDGVTDIGMTKGHSFPMHTDEDESDIYDIVQRRIEERFPESKSIFIRADLSEGLSELQSYKIFNAIKIDKPKKLLYEHLKPSIDEDRQFLEELALLNGVAEKISSGVVKRDLVPDVFWFKLSSLHGLSDFHGENSTSTKEAKQLLSDTVDTLNAAFTGAYEGSVLVTLITSDSAHTRKTRDVLAETTTKPPPAKADHNLAQSYSADYPIIFNIILWFGVAMLFSLLAICIFIGSMDPGRDSIIYRMTSTRIKKDN